MKRLFFLSALLVALTVLIVWAVLRLDKTQPQQQDKADAATEITVLQNGAVRQTTLAEWLPGVVAAEMPASFEPEALRAQAVAARTYVLDHRAHRPKRHPEADVCDDPGCCTAWCSDEAQAEKWGADTKGNRRRVADAVADTDGEILIYAGEPIRAVFHASSAGQTEDSAAVWGERPYLISVSSPETAEDVPNYVAVTDVRAEDLRAAVVQAHPEAVLPDDPAQWLGASGHDASGRVAAQPVGSVTLTGAEMRSLLKIRSTAYTVQYADGVFSFTTTGSGHGVGMSQYGANVMAKQGSDYREILLHYYPNTKLCKLNEETNAPQLSLRGNVLFRCAQIMPRILR